MPTVHLSMPPVFGTTFYAAIRAGSVAQTIQQVVVGCTGAATPRRSRPRPVTFEMWPDMSEFTRRRSFQLPVLRTLTGSKRTYSAQLTRRPSSAIFSGCSSMASTACLCSGFLVNLGDRSFDQILNHVRASSVKTGRVYAVCYDLTDAPKDRLYDLLVKDWKRLVDEQKVTQDKSYLHEGGKPVLFVWGFFSDRFDPALAHRIIDFFKHDGRYQVTLVGGCQWQWRTEKDAEWARAFRRFDAISPWNVGNYSKVGGQKHAATGHWKDDLTEAKKAGMAFLPVIYPGFSWTNLKGKGAAGATIPRLGGEFFWRQFVTAADLGIDMAYVAMFDEVDEGRQSSRSATTRRRRPRLLPTMDCRRIGTCG